MEKVLFTEMKEEKLRRKKRSFTGREVVFDLR